MADTYIDIYAHKLHPAYRYQCLHCPLPVCVFDNNAHQYQLSANDCPIMRAEKAARRGRRKNRTLIVS